MATKEYKIVANRIQTPDGTILQSFWRHDYKTYKDKNGETYMIDGGLDYQRTYANKEPSKNISVYNTDPHEKIREAFCWGKLSKEGHVFVPLMNLETDHIEAIVRTQNHIQPHIRKLFEDELEYRKVL